MDGGSECLLFCFDVQAKAQQSGKDKAASAAKSAQAQKSKGAKAKKKSWGKTKVKDKLDNDVFLDQKRFEKIAGELPKILCITRGIICEKFKVNGSIARALIQEIAKRGEIKRVGDAHSKFDLFTGVRAKTAAQKAEEDAAAAAAAESKKKGKK